MLLPFVSWLSFSVSFSLSSGVFIFSAIHRSYLLPRPLYPMNFPHCSHSRKYFRCFGSLFPFLLNRLATFCSWLNTYRFLSPQDHLGTYSVHEVWLRHRYVVVTHTQIPRRCLWRELYVYFEVTVRWESRIKYLWKRPYYAAIPRHVFSKLFAKETAWERWWWSRRAIETWWWRKTMEMWW